MKLPFTKMQGAGNDFVVIDATRKDFALSRKQIRALSSRHFGIGFDQLLVVEKTGKKGIDFRYRIFNADGGEVEQCGNGARCFVKFVRARGLSSKRELRVETRGGIIGPRLEPDGEVSVDMGAPEFSGKERIVVGDDTVDVHIVSMGNPHAVQVVREVELAPVTTQGPRIEHHDLFPDGVNAGYVQVLGRRHLSLRVWERGAGETLSCGTGACAAAVTAIRLQLVESPVRVDTRGGTLTITWDGGDNAVWMKGPAETAFEGTVDL